LFPQMTMPIEERRVFTEWDSDLGS